MPDVTHDPETDARRQMTGPHNPNWVGDRASYDALHSRVVRARGAAKTHDCEYCAEAGRTTPAHDWATKHGTQGFAVEDYLPLCRRCHQAYDGITDAAVALFQSDEHRTLMRDLWADPDYRARCQGEGRGNAVLTDWIVARSRHDHGMGMSVASLARQFRVSPRTLHSAVSGQTWQHVPDPYRMLADKVIERFNPPDSDEAEVALLMQALDVAAGNIEDQPCVCDREPGLPCFRCSALGQYSKQPVASSR